MKDATKRARTVSVAILLGVLGGALSYWLASGDETRKLNHLRENALCVLDLPAETASVSATFTTTRPVDKFHVGMQTRENREPLSISISGDQGVVGSVSVLKSSAFSLGRDIQPGTYTVTLRQENKGKGGMAVLSGEEPEYVAGWQIWSRTYLGLLVLSGICVLLSRRGKDTRIRGLSLTAFHSLLLGFAAIFIYLLFHEGGHALAEITFGRFDLARSDFWGIHGHPHSGGTMGPPLKPWQHRVISCAGPMLPTFAGIALFLLWGLPVGQRLRSLRPMVNLYFSAIVATLVFSEAVAGPAYLLGLITAEGDLIDYVTNAGGPVWLVKGFLWGIALISAFILWRVVRELQRAWKAQFLQRAEPPPDPGPV